MWLSYRYSSICREQVRRPFLQQIQATQVLCLRTAFRFMRNPLLLLGLPQVLPFRFSQRNVGSYIKAVCVSEDATSLGWSKNGRLLRDGEHGISLKQVEGVMILSIESLKPEHSGNYTCTARNDEGSSEYSAFLSVAAPPTWRKTPDDVSLSKDQKSNLECDAVGFPEPNITWTRDGGQL